MKLHFDFSVTSFKRCEFLPITEDVARAVRESGVQSGICHVFAPHTTAGIAINENADLDVPRDILARLDQLVPQGAGYLHREGNADAHIKAVLTGTSVSFPIRKGAPFLGTWQGVFFCEFDGPRNRRFHVDIVPAAND